MVTVSEKPYTCGLAHCNTILSASSGPKRTERAHTGDSVQLRWAVLWVPEHRRGNLAKHTAPTTPGATLQVWLVCMDTRLVTICIVFLLVFRVFDPLEGGLWWRSCLTVLSPNVIKEQRESAWRTAKRVAVVPTKKRPNRPGSASTTGALIKNGATSAVGLGVGRSRASRDKVV